MKVTKEYIHKELFASGDIYWNKKSGERVLITKAHDVINGELIAKLLDNSCDVTCDRPLDDFSDEVVSWFEASSKESSLKSKIAFRKKIIHSISIACFNQNEPSFIIDKLAWRMFSLMGAKQAQVFIVKDINFFKRNLSMVGAYALCAYLLGCYDEKFLKKTYSELLTKLLAMMDECPIVKIKASIELIRNKESFNESDHALIKEDFKRYLVSDNIFFERMDGSGIQGLSARELSDLERIMIGVHQYFGFNSYKQANVLDALKNGSFKIDKKIRSIILNEIYEKHHLLGNAG